jgi:hypothetical protein
MSVFAFFGDQVPVIATLDGLGAKQDWVFWLLTAEANAPEDRSCNMCRPGAVPVHSERVICTPVKETGVVKRKSWYRIDASLDNGQVLVHVMFWPVDGSTYVRLWTVLSGIDVTLRK